MAHDPDTTELEAALAAFSDEQLRVELDRRSGEREKVIRAARNRYGFGRDS